MKSKRSGKPKKTMVKSSPTRRKKDQVAEDLAFAELLNQYFPEMHLRPADFDDSPPDAEPPPEDHDDPPFVDTRSTKHFKCWVSDIVAGFPHSTTEDLRTLNNWVEQFAEKAVDYDLYFRYLNDTEAKTIKALLEKAQDQYAGRSVFSNQTIALRRRLVRIGLSTRMTDKEERQLISNLTETKLFPPEALDELTKKLRDEWGSLFPEKVVADLKAPKSGKRTVNASRLNSISKLWKELNPFERGFIFEHLFGLARIDYFELLEVLAHIPEACDKAETLETENLERIQGLSRTKNFEHISILAELYTRYSGKEPSHNPTGPFARFVAAVLETKIAPNEDAKNESIQRALAVSSSGRRREVLAIEPHPNFNYIMLRLKKSCASRSANW